MISSRQKLFREKWLWALCLAILVHVGFFLVFYLNVDKDKPTPVTSSRADVERSSMPADVSQSITPDTVKTYTVTDDTDRTDAIKTVDPNGITQPAINKEPLSTSNLDASNLGLTNLGASTSNASNPNEVRAAQTLTEGAASASMTSALTLKERDQRSERSTQADEALSAMSSNNTSLSKTDTPEEVKARAGLLSIDVPTQQIDNKDVKIDTGYLSAKSEVEDINSQLSAAINEVKKRNQQKIDEMQQLRDDTNNKDRQAVTSIAD